MLVQDTTVLGMTMYSEKDVDDSLAMKLLEAFIECMIEAQQV